MNTRLCVMELNEWVRAPTHMHAHEICNNEVQPGFINRKKKNITVPDMNIHEFMAIKNLSEERLQQTMTPEARELWAIHWNGDVIQPQRCASPPCRFIASLIKLLCAPEAQRAHPGRGTCLHIQRLNLKRLHSKDGHFNNC